MAIVYFLAQAAAVSAPGPASAQADISSAAPVRGAPRVSSRLPFPLYTSAPDAYVPAKADKNRGPRAVEPSGRDPLFGDVPPVSAPGL